MIERFSVGVSARQLAGYFEVEEPTSFRARYNVSPSQLVPVITSSGRKGFSFFFWGQPPGRSKNKTLAEKIINVQVEQIAERPTLKKTLNKNRCIIPADGFYSWKKWGKKSQIPWRFCLKNRGIFSMPGFWEEYDDEEGAVVHTFTLLTVQSNDFILPVNERMPVTFNKDQESKWLNESSTEEELLKLLVPAPSSLFEGFAVSPQLNSIEFDRPSLLLPVPPSDQHGNLTLFD